MNEKKESFLQKLLLTLVDKLLIAVILLIAAFFINKKLEAIKLDNQQLLQQQKQEFEKEKEIIARAYNEEWEAKEKKYQEDRAKNRRDYLEERAALERIYNEQRQDLVRENNQMHAERLVEIKANHDQRLTELKLMHDERLAELKTEVTLNSDLVKTSIEKIGEAWKKLNELNEFSEIYEKKLIEKNRKILNEYDSIINTNLAQLNQFQRIEADFPKGVNLKKIKQEIKKLNEEYEETSKMHYRSFSRSYLDYEKKQLEREFEGQYDDPSSNSEKKEKYKRQAMARQSKQKVLSIKREKINDLESKKELLSKTYLSSIKNQIDSTQKLIRNLQEKYEDLYQITYGPYLRDQTDKIKQVELFINANAFWIGELRKTEMISFLLAQRDFYKQIPKAITIEEIEVLKNTLDQKRADLFKLRDNLSIMDLLKE